MNAITRLIRAAILFTSLFTSLAMAVETLDQNRREFVFSNSNVAGFPSQSMGTLTIEQLGLDTKWTLAANWNSQYDISNPFVFGIDFNMSSGSYSQPSLALFDVVGTPVLKDFNSRGVFFETANLGQRFVNGNQASWIFSNTQISNFEIEDLHINALHNGQSVKFGTASVIPEPSTYLMLLIGLVGLGMLPGRREPALETLA